MTRAKSIAAAGALAVLALCAATLGAQQSNTQEITYLTFDHPVELPGVTLEPGTYEFRLADPFQRNVIQVFREDRSDIIGQWTFVPSERERPTEETVVMFREAPEGTTPAVQYWYFPGEKIGKEFIYPEDQARQIAERTGQRVRTEDGFVSPPAIADAGAPRPVGTSGSGESATATGTSGIADDGADFRGDADVDADIEAEADLAGAGADVNVDVDRADVQESSSNRARRGSLFAQPSAPAGSTTGFRVPQRSNAARADAEGRVDAESQAADQSAAAASAGASAQADVAERDATSTTGSAPAQPSAPAGSTTGSRGEVAGDRGAGIQTQDDDTVQFDADTERGEAAASASLETGEQPAPAGDRAADGAGAAGATVDASATLEADQGAAGQTAERQRDADEPRPVGTSGAAGAQGATTIGGAERPSQLPRTASPLALTGLIGLLSLAGAAGLRRYYR